MTAPSWCVEHRSGDAGAFHARPLEPESRTATFFRAEAPTLVLGSAQREENVDRDAAANQGIAVVRRRSGGGGVYLVPGEHVWLDLDIPRGDPLWHDDVGQATWWVGDLWRASLSALEPSARVHRGPMQRSEWSPAICFAGTGPGEVLVGDAKLVGISQRRTRDGARFQTVIHRRWRADVVASLVVPQPPVADLVALVAVCSATEADLTAALTSALPSASPAP